MLKNRVPLAHGIRSQGGTIGLFVGRFFDGQSGDVFDCELLARMADLKIEIMECLPIPGR
jgi:hypothetical protein